MPKLKLQGRKLCVSGRKLQSCCANTGGPCCATQACTLVADANGNWTYTSESAASVSFSVSSAPWFSGPAGNSPAYGGTGLMTGKRTATKAGLNHCNDNEIHDYFGVDSAFPSVFDPGGIVTAFSTTKTDQWFNPNVGGSFGIDQIGVTVTDTINLKNVSASGSGGVLIGGAGKAELPVVETLHEFIIGPYYDNRGGQARTSRSPGFARLRTAVYKDGTWAVWDISGILVGGTANVIPTLAGTCVLGFEATFSTTSQANIQTVCSGSYSYKWTAGAAGCSTTPATTASCGTVTVDGYFLTTEPGTPPSASPGIVPAIDQGDDPITGGGLLLP